MENPADFSFYKEMFEKFGERRLFSRGEYFAHSGEVMDSFSVADPKDMTKYLIILFFLLMCSSLCAYSQNDKIISTSLSGGIYLNNEQA